MNITLALQNKFDKDFFSDYASGCMTTKGNTMIRAKVYTQAPPIATGQLVVNGERVQEWSANLIFCGDVEGLTESECWHRARAKTSAPVMEWLK